MFNNFVFTRTPPPTVASPSPVLATAAVSTANSSVSSSAATTSVAGTLSSQLNSLAGTSEYLQSVILSLVKGLGVTVNVASNPDLGRALSAIYGEIPPAISAQMYAYTVAGEIGASQVNLAIKPDSTVQANPFQQQALITINKAVESSLADNGSFLSLAALSLRALQTQQAVYTNWQSLLAVYPAASGATGNLQVDVIPASTVDVGPEVEQAIQAHINDMSTTYGSLFTALTNVSSVSADIVCMVNSLSALSKTELAQMKGLFDLTSSMSVKESFVDISNGLTSFVFMQMKTEAAGILMQLDRVAQMALTPLRTLGGQLGSSVASAQQMRVNNLKGVIRTVTNDALLADGPLAGLAVSNTAASACGAKSLPPNPPKTPIPACAMSGSSGSLVSTGANDLSTLVDWALGKANQKFDTHLNALQKMMARTQKDTCNQVKLLTMVNNLTTLSSLTNSILLQQQKGSAVAGVTTTALSALGSILANTSSGNKVTYTVQNGSVMITPPAVPAPTPAAATIFANAGIQTSLAGITQSV